jgi:hypothetical protein
MGILRCHPANLRPSPITPAQKFLKIGEIRVQVFVLNLFSSVFIRG